MWTEIEHMQALEREVAHLQTLLQPLDTGHIRTTISVLLNRIHEIGNTLDLELDQDRSITANDFMRIVGGSS